MKKAICAGHVCIDLTPMFPGRSIPADISSVLVPGKLVQMHGMDIHTGGAVANTGLAMKRLGVDVQLQGKIGNDAMGQLVRAAFEAENAAEGLLISENSSTSYSVVLAPPGIDRIFLHDPGANDTFCCDDMNWDAFRSASLMHFGYPPLMRLLFQDNGVELERIFRHAKEMGVATSLDMAASDPASEGGMADWQAILSRVLPYVDFFVPSAEELAFMLDKTMYHRWLTEARGGDATDCIRLADMQKLSEAALSMGARIVLIKCGARGIYYRSADEATLAPLCTALDLNPAQWACKEGFECSFVPEKVLSGTGAGDTCIAAFLTAVLRGDGFHKAVTLAAAEGACCVAAYDALSGIKPLPELETMIAKGWKKNACELE